MIVGKRAVPVENHHLSKSGGLYTRGSFLYTMCYILAMLIRDSTLERSVITNQLTDVSPIVALTISGSFL